MLLKLIYVLVTIMKLVRLIIQTLVYSSMTSLISCQKKH